MANPFQVAPEKKNDNPLVPPPMLPPPPMGTPPGAGFQSWASDPLNSMKVQASMTSPSAKLQPNAQPMASATPPAIAPKPSPLLPPSMQEDMKANPGAYQNRIAKGKVGNILNMIAATSLGAAGGMKGNPGAGANYAMEVFNHDEGVGDANQKTYNSRIVAPQDAALNKTYKQAEIDNLNSQIAERGKPKAEKPENAQQLYADAVSDAMSRGVDPNKDPKVMQLADAITSLQKQPAAPKEPNKDDRAISIYAKPKEKRTPEEAAYLRGYEQYVEKNKVEPRVLGAQATPITVAGPTPGSVVYANKKDAVGKEAPSGISTQVPLKAAVDMTSGRDSATITAGQTLTHHLDLYDKAVDAVHNGDTQFINRIGNEMGIQMGNDAQTNLSLIRQGVAMEAARYYTGGVPGEAEINQFNKSLSGDGSPKQMHGGANTVRAMANGKLQGLQGQYTSAQRGRPNFSNPLTSPTINAGPKVGTIEDGHKFTGGDPKDPKNWVVVKGGK